jgi:hypothetical protein
LPLIVKRKGKQEKTLVVEFLQKAAKRAKVAGVISMKK